MANHGSSGSRIAFIIHGKYRRLKKLEKEIKKFFSACDVHISVTAGIGFATSLARQAALDGAKYIICCGGDGTLNETVNGVMESGKKDVKVGLLPCGTANDFIKTIKGPDSVELLKHAIESHHFRHIDLGLAEYNNKSGQIEKRYFINIADVGIGGVIVEKMSNMNKFFSPFLIYQYSILSTMLSYKNLSVKITTADVDYSGKVMNVICANGKWFGSGLGISPDAEVDDGLLNLIIIGNINIADYLRHLPNIKKSRFIEHPQVYYHTTREVVIEPLEKPMAIDMDGEFIGFSPMRIKVVPKALEFIF